MERNYLSKAIVLKRQDYRENDSLVVFYTQNQGKLSLVARGTKKPKSKLVGHIEPLNLVDLMIIKGKGQDYVGSVISKEAYLNLKENLSNLHWAFLGANWLLRFSEEGGEEVDLFNLFANYLKALDKMPADSKQAEGEILFSIFALRMMAIIGYQPQTKSCLQCRQKLEPKSHYFDLLSGGMLCPTCYFAKVAKNQEQYLKISEEGIKFLRFIFDNNLFLGKKIKINKKIAREINVLASSFLAYRL